MVGVLSAAWPGGAQAVNAARNGDLGVKRLGTRCRRGAAIQQFDAMQAARLRGHREIVEFLASKGADTKAAIPPPEKLVDALFNSVIKGVTPGAAALVAQDGKILFEKGYGFANVEHRVPVTPETKFRIGSITKQFTAAAILKLQEAGSSA
jgi:CubicO group peptidase (beta-lactamase class C family)